MDSIKKLAQRRLSTDVPSKGLDKLTSFIANNPMIDPQALAAKAMELGYDPDSALTQTLGSVLADKHSVNLNTPLEDLLNEVYRENPTPGGRYIVNPKTVKSKLGKQIASEMEDSYGISSGFRKPGASRGEADYSAIEDAMDEKGKIKQLATGGHELRHQEDRLIRPNFKSKAMSGDMGHHFGPGTFEANELIREVRGLPADEKIAKEIVKRSKGAGSELFRKLPGIGLILGGATAIASQDASAAIPVLSEAESLGPEQGSEDYEIENPQKNPTARRDALRNILRNRK